MLHCYSRSLSSAKSNIIENVVILLGAPGGGKGTISKYLVRDFQLCHISTGDILRNHIAMQTPLGKSVKDVVKLGGLVPDVLIFDAMEQFIKATITGSAKTSVLLDGFPRTVVQAQTLQQKYPVAAVISLEIPHETIIDRLSKRWIHSPSGRTYSYDFNPPKVLGVDDYTGEALTQREDDKPETVRRRLEDYENMKMPIKRYYDGIASVRSESFYGTESKVIYPKIKSFLDQEMALKNL